MKEWIESIRDLKKRADREYEEGDYVDLCIVGRKMMEQLLVIQNSLTNREEVNEIRVFFSKYQGEEDMFKPYLAQLWGGIPTPAEGKECMKYIEKIMSLIEEIKVE